MGLDQSQQKRSTAVVEEVPITIDPMRPGCVCGVAVCRRPVVAVLTAGCVHEHIRRGAVCAHHLAKSLICRVCHDNPVQPHPGCTVHQLRVESPRVASQETTTESEATDVA